MAPDGRGSNDDMPFHEGERLTNFASVDLVAQRVASGGFGVVALGPNAREGGRWSALKTLRRRYLEDAHVRELFVREGLTWVGLWPHANVLTAQFVTHINSLPVLLLDYAASGSLRDVLEQGWLRWQATLLLAQQTLAGLAYLHTPDPAFLRPQPIVHRDLKPENVLLNEYGFAQITDFGLAKVVAAGLRDVGAVGATVVSEANDVGSASATTPLATLTGALTAPLTAPNGQAAGATQAYQTRRGVALGTPAYMAPEQWEDAALAGPPADVYAAGLLIVELLTSRHPLFPLNERHSHAEWRQASEQAADRLPPLETLLPAEARDDWPDGLAAGVAEVARACLARDPAARPTAGQALTSLQQLATQLGEAAYAPPSAYAHTPEHELDFWLDSAIAYTRFSRYEEALARNDRALALGPQDPDVLLNRGNILSGLRRYEEAEDAYQRSLAAHPAEATDQRSRVWNMLGASRNDQERYAEAEQAYAQAVALNPGNANAWFNRAHNTLQWAATVAQDGHLAQARTVCAEGLTWAAEARRLNPQNHTTQRLLAALQALAQALAQASS